MKLMKLYFLQFINISNQARGLKHIFSDIQFIVNKYMSISAMYIFVSVLGMYSVSYGNKQCLN